MDTRSYVGQPGARRTWPRRVAALLVGLGALVGLLLGTAVPASAHAALIHTDPADGSVVATAPQRVVLTFSEGVLLSDDSLRVLDPHGTDVAVGTPGHAQGKDSGATSTVALRSGLGDGTYTVAWRAISQDSHPVAGAFTFSVGSPSRTEVDLSGVAARGGGAASTLYGVGRYVAYAGFALLVGSAVFLSVCWPRGALLRPLQRIAATGWVAMAASTIALLLLRGPYVNGKGLGQAIDLDVMRDQLQTRPGAALLSRLLLLAAAAVFLAVLFGSYARREDPEERADLAWGLGIGGTVIAVGIAATWAMAEHASVGIQRQVAMPVDVVHLLSMAVWLGGLITLLTALWAPTLANRPIEPHAVRRFSLIGLTAITLLVGTGVYQAWRQMGSWRAFTDTSYGRTLLVKIGLVCALVVIAWFSRRWTARLGQAPGAGAVPTSAAASAASAAASASVPPPASASAAARVRFQGRAKAKGAREPVAAMADRTDSAPAGPASGGRGAGGADGARAEQLRRQQAARSAARARKVLEADPFRGALRRSVLAEAAVAVVLLGVTTVLSGSQPGRAAEEQKALAPAPSASSGAGTSTSGQGPISVTVPYDTGGPKGKGTAAVTVTPGRAATPNQVELVVKDAAGSPVDVPEVRLAFTLPAQNLGPIPITLRHTGTGRWTASAAQLPLPGTWQMSVTVRTSDIDEVTETKKVKVTS
ncbi:putative integral membrane protein [Actinacidiphila reveromycinica]|uniref:Putative integral membrane protein n=1 Tax=Actinacidiphila reveromycinica TaxID=659352 RepID=A0A7U3UTU6_9ACTN|nr:FixH family protein [Streptomyces sp. SN-593]BBA98633.1 putative integral membrane protein [Streptomyces sp. SN-593]